jgi:DNA polymerase-3 subunit chi
MTEVLFYHLEHKPWEDVLPRLLAATVARGWRAVVQVGPKAEVESVSETLWASPPDNGFLAHGTAADGRGARQPIWLTAGEDAPNGATVRFHIEGARCGEVSGLERAVILFDGADASAVEQARADWRRYQGEGHKISYWQQDEDLRWVNRSEKPVHGG